jgi:hypothetical protein
MDDDCIRLARCLDICYKSETKIVRVAVQVVQGLGEGGFGVVRLTFYVFFQNLDGELIQLAASTARPDNPTAAFFLRSSGCIRLCLAAMLASDYMFSGLARAPRLKFNFAHILIMIPL